MKEYPVGLISIDLDGTLLRNDKTISEENVKTLMEAQEKGIVVCINTGRMAQDAVALAHEYGLNCAVCGGNGAHIIDAQGTTLFETMIPGDVAVALCEIGRESGLRVAVHFDGFMGLHPENSTYKPVSKMQMPCYCGFDEVVKHARNGARKIVMGSFAYDPRLAETRQLIAERFPQLPIASSWAGNIEINAENTGKDAALFKMGELFNVTPERAMALGDAENDLPVLRVVGYSVAMANASDEVKTICRFETKSNEESGVAYAVRRWAMGEEA